MKLLYILTGLLLITSCKQATKTVINPEVYAMFITDKKDARASTTTSELVFWSKKIKEDSLQLPALGKAATVYRKLFRETGNIENIIAAEKCLQKAVDIAAIGKKSYVLALAQNYITQHRFKDAKELLDPYENEKEDKSVQWVLFDVNMELGLYEDAVQNLSDFQNYNDYNYLIRLAKFMDYKGNLGATIKYMEQAMAKAERSKSKSLMIWTYTNLADYYGHAGRIEDSRNYYLKTLTLDPDNAYAKKGIAWILFSHENNATKALALLNSISERHQLPDYYLLKAEIADHQHNKLLKHRYLSIYLNKIGNPIYGAMYNTHKITIYAEETGDTAKALQIAKEEIINRETPQTYVLLAYSYLLNDEKEKALNIINTKVKDKTYEPLLQYYMAAVYKENGLTVQVQNLKEELKEALYELGPGFKSRIGNL